MQKHIKSVDYLRGVLALCIVCYHYLSWTSNLNITNNTLLFRIALYGVSIFFIISGFSLVIAHKSINFKSFYEILEYFKRRIARIYPLFWLVIVLSLIIGFRQLSSVNNWILQFSILFGVFKEGALTPGAWSIGVEITYYLIFPILMLLTNLLLQYNKTITLILYSISIIFFLYISMFYNGYYSDIGDAYFRSYVSNFSNHIYFFLFGMLVAIFYKELENKIISYKYLIPVVLTITIVILSFVEVNSNESYAIVNGLYRIFFSTLSFIFFLTLLFIKKENIIFDFFGKISYTLYLTHPLSFYMYFKYATSHNFFNMILVFLFSIVLATIIFYIYEIPFKNLINSLRIPNVQR